MGYTTEFEGRFSIAPVLTEPHRRYLEQFSRSRRMRRDPDVVATLPDPLREAVGLPLGPHGDFFVSGEDSGAVDYNTPPGNPVVKYWEDGRRLAVPKTILGHHDPQPGLWCQWIPGEEGTTLEWDGGEKFYDYVEWLAYLIDHFFTPWGYTLNGEVYWTGDDPDDQGVIRVTENVIDIGHRSNEYVFWQ